MILGKDDVFEVHATVQKRQDPRQPDLVQEAPVRVERVEGEQALPQVNQALERRVKRRV